MQFKDEKDKNDTSLIKRIIMMLVAVGALLCLYYFMGGKGFPTDISYKNLR